MKKLFSKKNKRIKDILENCFKYIDSNTIFRCSEIEAEYMKEIGDILKIYFDINIDGYDDIKLKNGWD